MSARLPEHALLPPTFSPLISRSVLRLGGPDRLGFLQSLVSNDVTRVSAEWSVYAALLTPQGKYLHDFFVAQPPPAGEGSAEDEALLLDVEAERRTDLLDRLRHYKLRARVTFEDLDAAYEVAALTGGGAFAATGLPETPGATLPCFGGLALVDPRLAELGVRLLTPRSARAALLAATGAVIGGAFDYDLLRLELGVPDGSRDLVVDKSLLLEANLDALNGVSWTKGCYVGQELTARTRYRGLIRRRLHPVRVIGDLPAPGTPIHQGEQEVGEVRSGCGSLALALIRVELLDPAATAGAAPLVAGDATLTLLEPAWEHP